MRDVAWLIFAVCLGFAGFIAGTEWSLGWWRKHGKATHAKRAGRVVRVRAAGIHFWERVKAHRQVAAWPRP